jgi:hypothetical protein
MFLKREHAKQEFYRLFDGKNSGYKFMILENPRSLILMVTLLDINGMTAVGMFLKLTSIGGFTPTYSINLFIKTLDMPFPLECLRGYNLLIWPLNLSPTEALLYE